MNLPDTATIEIGDIEIMLDRVTSSIEDYRYSGSGEVFVKVLDKSTRIPVHIELIEFDEFKTDESPDGHYVIDSDGTAPMTVKFCDRRWVVLFTPFAE